MAQGNRNATSNKWGELPAREREEAMQFLRERFPSRYKELIEKYYKALAEQDQN